MIAGLFATTVVQLVGSRCFARHYHNRFAWDREAADALSASDVGCSRAR
jgi:hypothetical protein